jgi:tetratricopeptide (TPR) repeat protein
MEEVAFLRQKCSSMALRGHYTECAKLIEDNLKLMYTHERWPENFFSVLKTYQRCYPALGHSESVEDHVAELLKKNDIPFVFASYLRGGEAPLKWNAEYFRDRALHARAEQDYDTALACCRIALKIDPSSSNLHLLCGWIYEDMDKIDDAITMIAQALEINEANMQASQTIARLYSKTNIAKALEYIDKAIAASPHEPGFYAEKAAILLTRGDKEGALALYDKASELDPYNPDYAFRKGELYVGDGNETAAIIQYKRAVALNAGHALSLYRLACLHERRQPAAALEFVTPLVTAEPKNMDALLLRARLLTRLGDHAGAMTQYKSILELDEKNIEALGGIASVYLADNYTLAADYYGRALAIEPGNIPFLMGKARAHLGLGQSDKAIDLYKNVIALDKNSHAALSQLARLTAETDVKAAFDYITKALALDGENPEYHTQKADLLLRMGRRDEAISSLNIAVKYDPGNAALHYELGRLLQNIGNRASAEKNLEEAVSLDPRHAQAFGALAELLLYSEPDRALHCINTAIGLDVANAAYYFIKSRIASQIQEDRHAQDMIRQNMTAQSAEDAEEMGALSTGDSLRVALMYVNRAIELAPNNNTYLCERARLLYLLGQSSKALDQYQTLLKSDANNHEALYGVGIILLSKKDEKPLEYFEKAITLAPSAAKYHAGKAAALAREPQTYRAAIDCYDQALLLDTYNDGPALDKARLLESRGDLFEAMDAYRRTLLINPNNLPASAKMGELLARIQPDNALVYIDHAIELDPSDWKLHMWRGRILYGLSRPEEAENVCGEALVLCGQSGEGYFTLAGILSDFDARTALRYAVQAVERDDNKGEYHALCGKLCLELGEYENAQAYFQKAMTLNPKDGEAREKNVELLYRQGAPESVEAAEALADSPSALLLKAKVFDEIADPPRTQEAVDLLAQALKQYPDDLPLREEYVALLGKKRSFLKYPIEKAKLERLRKKREKALESAQSAEAISFERPEETPAPGTAGETGGQDQPESAADTPDDSGAGQEAGEPDTVETAGPDLAQPQPTDSESIQTGQASE